MDAKVIDLAKFLKANCGDFSYLEGSDVGNDITTVCDALLALAARSADMERLAALRACEFGERLDRKESQSPLMPVATLPSKSTPAV